MLDALLIFPPQWSPFQPPLSLPSLTAWLRRAGFKVSSLDLNLSFYEWLLSEECAAFLIGKLDSSDWPEELRFSYLTHFRNAADFREDLRRLQELRQSTDRSDPADYCRHHYVAIKSIETYLRAVSQVAGDFTISPYGFRLPAGKFDAAHFERMLAAPPAIVEIFLRQAIANGILAREPRLIGLSCIGYEQLYLTLLLGKLIKESTPAPVAIGGTIAPRLFDHGSLPARWFGRFFDVIVRNEGEIPCERLISNLLAGRRLGHDVPSILYLEDGRVRSSESCPALATTDLPIPDFDDLPLDRYLSAEITLPLLSSRDCYWGKCEFCHRGLVQSEKYGPYGIDAILATVEHLARRYNVRHFAFYDDAIPPKTIRAMGKMFAPHSESGRCFTGLIKFERYFQREDFHNLHRIGFRALYSGLESASERVLALMKKNNSRATISANLEDAAAAGIWMHCFLFFGFPGETDSDAEATYDFVLSNSRIIGSFGCGVFSLELGTPIADHLEDYAVSSESSGTNPLLIYRDYTVAHGLTPDRAAEWMQRLKIDAQKLPKYSDAAWVPDEYLLSMLSVMTPESLLAHASAFQGAAGLPEDATVPEIISYLEHPLEKDSTIFLNRLNGRAALLDDVPAWFVLQVHKNRAPVRRSAANLRAFLGDWALRVDNEALVE